MKKKTKTKPNIGLLRKIQRAILKHHDQFEMCSLFSSSLDNDHDAGGCGTAGCIAGWALHLTSKNKKLNETDKAGLDYSSSIKKAGRLIGIPIILDTNPGFIHPLFFYDQWPEQFQSRYKKARRHGTSKAMARISADRIESFIKTGE